MKEAADEEEHSSKLSNATAILFAIVLIYLTFTALWFIQRRHRVTAACRCCRQTSFPLRQLRYLFGNNHNLEYNYNNLPNHHDLDEKKYKSWSILEVASWTRSKLVGVHQLNNNTYGAVQNHYMSNQDDNIILQTAIDAIITQRIDGSSLDFITLEFLSRWVPFGTAVKLHQHYNALICGGNYNKDENMSVMSNDSSLPSWYRLQSDSSNYHLHDEKSQEDSLSSEHAQRIMRERFGLSLPTLRTEEKILSNPPDDSALELPERGGSIEENNANLGEVLDAMPPHIRAAAERRPELVAELLSNRQSRNNTVHNKGHLLPVHEEDHDEETNVEDIDSESASLLRRRLIV